MTPPARITVLLADDHTVVREGLRKVLDAEPGLRVIGEAATGRQAVRLARKLHPDVVVMDIAMPLLNGMEATRHIRLEAPDTKVLILSAHSDDAYIARVIELGAVGYLIKQTSAHCLAQAIREVHQGGTFFSPAVARRIQGRRQEQGRKRLPRRVLGRLSPREIEVLRLVAEGKSNKQVAADLGISVKTVEKHRDHLMHKLDIHDTANLTRYAIAEGIIEADVKLTIA